MTSGVYPRKPRSLQARFLAKVHPVATEAGCLEWRGSTSPLGYGQIFVGNGVRRLIGAHRAAWELKNGPIPHGLVVLHKCDNPRCVNVDHLRIGTKADNSADMVAKARQRRGEDLPQAKLTWDDVQTIRQSSEKQSALAARFGVTQATISMAKTGARWRVPPASALRQGAGA